MQAHLAGEDDRCLNCGEPMLDAEGGLTYAATHSCRALTPNQKLMLRLMAEGYTNHEIAEHRHVKYTTVKTYMHRMFERLGARNRAHAVAIAFRKGWVQ